MGEFEFDVFVSHNRLQTPWVRDVVNQWRHLGLRVFFDEEDIGIGEDIVEGIERGLRTSEHIALVITPSAMASPWVAMETSITLFGDADARKRRLIPILLEPTDSQTIRLSVNRLNFVDLTDAKTRQSGYHRLLTFLTGGQRASWPDPPVYQMDTVLPLKPIDDRPPVEAPIFDMGSVVKPEFFIGRTKELSDSERIVRSGKSLLLVGEFRDGKTSLCQMLIHKLIAAPDNDVFPIYMNVQSWPDVTQETFLEHTIIGMIGDISRKVFAHKYTDLRRVGRQNVDTDLEWLADIYQQVRARTYADEGKPPRPFLVADFVHYHSELMQMLQKRGWKTCVVFYDEANKLPERLSPERLIVHNESIEMVGGVSVYAASPTLRESFLELRQSIPYQVEVGPFKNIDEMKQLIARYYFGDSNLASALPVDNQAMIQMWEFSRRKPYLIQLLARQSFVLASDARATEVQKSHVETAYRTLREEHVEGFFFDRAK